MSTPCTTAAVSVDELRQWLEQLSRIDPDVDDASRIDQIAALEQLKSACGAAQARITYAFAASQVTDAVAAGRSADDARRSAGAQVALARRESPVAGRRHLGLAAALVQDMPCTLAALDCGAISEWRATLVAKEFGCLTAADRKLADAQIGPRLIGLGDRSAATTAAGIAYRLDPASVMARIRGAVTDRRVTIRPAPDTMAIISALLPVAQGVAAYASLRRHADSVCAEGDLRTRSQRMADEFVSRLTGQSGITCAEDGLPMGAGGLELQLVMTDRTLLDGDQTPAIVAGYGPIPAPLARRLISAQHKTKVWVRRLYTDPDRRTLVAMDSRRRLFPDAARRFLIARDQMCRTPYCDAPIRHTDHITPVRAAGPTSIHNGQGLCENCNHIKETGQWVSRAGTHGGVEIRTPTGHCYAGEPPELPTSPPWPAPVTDSKPRSLATGGQVGTPDGRACAWRADSPVRSEAAVVRPGHESVQ